MLSEEQREKKLQYDRIRQAQINANERANRAVHLAQFGPKPRKPRSKKNTDSIITDSEMAQQDPQAGTSKQLYGHDVSGSNLSNTLRVLSRCIQNLSITFDIFREEKYLSPEVEHCLYLTDSILARFLQKREENKKAQSGINCSIKGHENMDTSNMIKDPLINNSAGDVGTKAQTNPPDTDIGAKYADLVKELADENDDLQPTVDISPATQLMIEVYNEPPLLESNDDLFAFETGLFDYPIDSQEIWNEVQDYLDTQHINEFRQLLENHPVSYI